MPDQSPLTKQDLTDALAALKTELKADIERVETTLKADIERVETTLKADIERVETSLLTEFHKWSSPAEARARTHAAALRAIDLEMEAINDRVQKLEGRKQQ